MSIEPIPLEAVESKLPDQLKDQIAVAAHDSNSNFVEGGLQGWLNVLGATVSSCMTCLKMPSKLRLWSFLTR